MESGQVDLRISAVNQFVINKTSVMFLHVTIKRSHYRLGDGNINTEQIFTKIKIYTSFYQITKIKPIEMNKFSIKTDYLNHQ